MSKRFTDTDKWKKKFIKNLDPEFKLFWVYLLDDCDHAGVWHVEVEVASLRLGVEYNEEELLDLLKNHIVPFDNGTKWFIPDFIKFQYGELQESNRAHKSVIKKINKYGLEKYLSVDLVEKGTSNNAIRERVTQKVKDKIYARDEFECQYCSNQFPKKELVVDHIVAINNGGTSEDENLATACVRCNSHKTDMDLKKFIEYGHDFLKPTERILEKLYGASYSLEAPSKNLEGVKDKDKDKDKEQDMDQDKRGECEGGKYTIESRKKWDGDQPIDYASFVDFWNEYHDTNIQLTDNKKNDIEKHLKHFTGYQIQTAIYHRRIALKDSEYLNSWESLFTRKIERMEKYLNLEVENAKRSRHPIQKTRAEVQKEQFFE